MYYTDNEINTLDEGFRKTYVHNLVLKFLLEHGEPTVTVDNMVFYDFLSEELARKVPPQLGQLLAHNRIMGDRLVINAFHKDFTEELRRQRLSPARPPSPPSDEEDDADVPGLPLDASSVPIAIHRLLLPEQDAKKALAPHTPSGGTIVVSGYPEPLYHETDYASFSTGARNPKGANKITYFYIRRKSRYYLVAWGHHIEGKGGAPAYVIDEQYDEHRGRLKGNTLTFT